MHPGPFPACLRQIEYQGMVFCMVTVLQHQEPCQVDRPVALHICLIMEFFNGKSEVQHNVWHVLL